MFRGGATLFTFIFYIQYITEHGRIASHTMYSMMRLGQAYDMSVFSDFLGFTSHTVAAMRREQVGVLAWNHGL